MRSIKNGGAIVTTQGHLAAVFDCLTDNVPIYRYDASYVMPPHPPKPSDLFPDSITINSYEQIANVQGETYFAIFPEEENAFFHNTSGLQLSFVGGFKADFYAIKLYVKNSRYLTIP